MSAELVLVIAVGLFALSVASGMLGLGVAFAAFGFARSGLVSWRPALLLTAVAAAMAPLGSWLAQYTAQGWIWGVYLLAVAYLSFQMFRPAKRATDASSPPDLRMAILLTVPIAVLAGLLGVGPGFLLMPVLILVGFDLQFAAVLIVVGAAGSFLGARLTSRYASGPTLKRAFGILIVVMTAVKVITLVSS